MTVINFQIIGAEIKYIKDSDAIVEPAVDCEMFCQGNNCCKCFKLQRNSWNSSTLEVIIQVVKFLKKTELYFCFRTHIRFIDNMTNH